MGDRKKVLVVDDEKLIVKTTCILLRRMGHDTLEAHSGEECLAIVAANRPDLILLDLVMPGMDGWQTLEKLQADGKTAGIPVVIFTAREYANAEMVNQLRGAAGQIRKPFEPDDLEEVLERLKPAGGPSHVG